ncbi:MAG: hypothetical protein ACI845_000622 [Gammaproteobacteria bacterium]
MHIGAEESFEGLQLAFPFLAWISGERVNSIDEWYFPSLSWIGGNLEVDFKPAQEYLVLPSLQQLHQLKVHFRENNQDLHGLDALKNLHTLVLNNDLDIHIKQSGLFCFGALQMAGSTLIVADSPCVYRLDSLGPLQQIGGLRLENSGIRDLDSLQTVSMTGDELIIRGNNTLDDCVARQLARLLLEEPNRTNFDTSKVKVFGNGNPHC